MISRRNTLILAMGMPLTFTAPTQSALAAVTAESASAFIDNVGKNAILVLTSKVLAVQERKSQFKKIILSSFDVNGIGRYAIGRYWRLATDAQKSNYLKAYEKALVQTYTGKFFEYSGESLNVTSANAGVDSTMVHSTVTSPTGTETYTVDWMVIAVAGETRLLDVVIDGVSTLQTQKQDYLSFLQSAGGKVDALTARLEAIPD